MSPGAAGRGRGTAPRLFWGQLCLVVRSLARETGGVPVSGMSTIKFPVNRLRVDVALGGSERMVGHTESAVNWRGAPDPIAWLGITPRRIASCLNVKSRLPR